MPPLDGKMLSVRAYNILKREGIKTVGELLALLPDDLDKMRNMKARVVIEIDGHQKQLAELLDRDIRQILIDFLTAPHIGCDERGVGVVVDELLRNFEIETK